MNTRSRFITHLKRFFALYVVVALAVTFALGWAFSLALRPSKSETVKVFVCTEKADEQKLDEYFESIRPENVRAVESFVYDKKDAYIDMFFTIKGAECDLFVIPASLFERVNKSKFLPLVAAELEEAFASVELLTVDSTCYGIKIYDKDTRKGYIVNESSFDGALEEDYYLLFNKNSSRVGSFNGGENADTVYLVKKILSGKSS